MLEGSVRRAGDRVRVTAQLSEVGGDRAIWSDRYDRDLTDIFDVQDEITGKILAALHVHLAGRAGARKFAGTEGYDAFLRGQYHARRGEFRRASDWYERAVNLDPGNADLWAERARHLGYQMSLGLIPNTGSSRASRKEYFERALAIDPSHWALAHRAVYTFIEDRQYQRAIDQLVEVVGSNTNSWEAVMYLTFALGAVDRQCDGYYKAAKRFSLLTNQFDTEVQMLLDSGRLDEARDLLGSTSRFSTSTLAFCRARLAAIERDVATLETLVADGVKNVRRPHSYFAALVPYLRGDYESAREIISKDKRANGYQSYLSKHEIALIERDLDAAAMYYGKAVHATEPAAMFWHRDTCFLNQVFPEFVAFPPYQKILEDIGLDPKSTAKIRIPGLPF